MDGNYGRRKKGDDAGFVIRKSGELFPGIENFKTVYAQEVQKASEAEANKIIKNFKFKNIAKSAGICALVTGAIALCTALIYEKVKEKEQ